MDEGKLTELLHRDEGVVDEIYLDHLGYKTFGAGHLAKESDPEFTQAVGTKVSSERINECFREDLRTTLFDCERLYPHFYELPENAQMVIASMAFNLGRPKLSKFKNMKAAVDAGDYVEASAQMLDSRWAQQLPNRSARLAKMMREA
jgi:lysozyme